MMKKVAIIGAGNMGGAIARGLARHKDRYRLTVTAAHTGTLEKYSASGIQATLDNRAAAADADVVILGVKPWQVFPVLEDINNLLSGKLLLSLAAGIPSGEIAAWLAPSGVRAAYTVIPNLAAEIDKVTTPGGITIRGLNAMEKAGFSAAVIAGLTI